MAVPRPWPLASVKSVARLVLLDVRDASWTSVAYPSADNIVTWQQIMLMNLPNCSVAPVLAQVRTAELVDIANVPLIAYNLPELRAVSSYLTLRKAGVAGDVRIPQLGLGAPTLPSITLVFDRATTVDLGSISGGLRTIEDLTLQGPLRITGLGNVTALGKAGVAKTIRVQGLQDTGPWPFSAAAIRGTATVTVAGTLYSSVVLRGDSPANAWASLSVTGNSALTGLHLAAGAAPSSVGALTISGSSLLPVGCTTPFAAISTTNTITGTAAGTCPAP